MDIKQIKETFKNTNAFYWVSFEPEKRLESFTNNFISNINEIKELCEKYELSSEKFENKLYNLAMKYLGSQARCVSWAISGPARFPVKTQEKRQNYCENHLNNYVDYVNNFEKLLKRITRKSESENDKKAKWEKQIEERKKEQEIMKTFNKEAKKDFKTAFEKLPQNMQEEILHIKSIFNMEIPHFPAFKLSNNLANIKRLEQQIKLIDKSRENKDGQEFVFDGGKVAFDSQEIRYNIYFDEIPSVETRTKIKSLGFKWSPTRKAWTRNAKTIRLEDIKNIL